MLDSPSEQQERHGKKQFKIVFEGRVQAAVSLGNYRIEILSGQSPRKLFEVSTEEDYRYKITCKQHKRFLRKLLLPLLANTFQSET